MGSIKDPEGAEKRVLDQMVDFSGLRVLEIGCGDGRITWLYAGEAARVLGVDTESESIAFARKSTPQELADKVRFRVANVEKLRVRPKSFDIAFLSWSL